MKFISGRKLRMTQIWSNDRLVAVTPVAAGPCLISQVKTKEKDTYTALQVAYGLRKEKNIKKPQLGHFKASGAKPVFVKEFRVDNLGEIKVGDTISVGTFNVGDLVSVTGISKGRGFQGVVKRHGFAGGRKTHGNKDQERMPGSIGPKGPARVFKGTRMGGRMGGDQVTVSNLEVMEIDEVNNIIFIKGALPGAINGFISIKGPGDLKVNLQASFVAVKNEDSTESVAEENQEVVVETSDHKNEKAEAEVATKADNENPVAAEVEVVKNTEQPETESKPELDQPKEVALETETINTPAETKPSDK